jgi:hypothetical protein
MRRVAALLFATAAITLGAAPAGGAHEPPGCEVAHMAAEQVYSTPGVAHEHICHSVP